MCFRPPQSWRDSFSISALCQPLHSRHRSCISQFFVGLDTWKVLSITNTFFFLCGFHKIKTWTVASKANVFMCGGSRWDMWLDISLLHCRPACLCQGAWPTFFLLCCQIFFVSATLRLGNSSYVADECFCHTQYSTLKVHRFLHSPKFLFRMKHKDLSLT